MNAQHHSEYPNTPQRDGQGSAQPSPSRTCPVRRLLSRLRSTTQTPGLEPRDLNLALPSVATPPDPASPRRK